MTTNYEMWTAGLDVEDFINMSDEEIQEWVNESLYYAHLAATSEIEEKIEQATYPCFGYETQKEYAAALAIELDNEFDSEAEGRVLFIKNWMAAAKKMCGRFHQYER